MRDKIFIFFMFFIICDTVSSQDIQVNVVQNNLGVDYKIRDFVVSSKLLKVEDQYGAEVRGSVLLYDNWENDSKVQIKGKKFSFNNVNFNIQNNEFMAEIGRDSVFTVNQKDIDFIIINDEKFIYQLYEGKNKFFEVLLENKEKCSLYKGYHIRILPKSDVGMLSRPFDEIRKEEKLYILKDTELVVFKLKKKDILTFIDKDKQKDILKYMKEKKLSFKKEKDVLEIFKYYHNI